MGLLVRGARNFYKPLSSFGGGLHFVHWLETSKEGSSILIYIDENIGTNLSLADSKNKNTCKVQFCSADLNARMGFSALSYMAMCPVIPMLLEQRDDANSLRVYDAIENSDLDRDKYYREVCSKVWGVLSDRVKSDPTQWESWRYEGLSLNLASLAKRFTYSENNVNDESKYLFSEQRYILFDNPEQPILYDRVLYKVIPLNSASLERIKYFKSQVVTTHTSDKFFMLCVDLRVLISSKDVK